MSISDRYRESLRRRRTYRGGPDDLRSSGGGSDFVEDHPARCRSLPIIAQRFLPRFWHTEGLSFALRSETLSFPPRSGTGVESRGCDARMESHRRSLWALTPRVMRTLGDSCERSTAGVQPKAKHVRKGLFCNGLAVPRYFLEPFSSRRDRITTRVDCRSRPWACLPVVLPAPGVFLHALAASLNRVEGS